MNPWAFIAIALGIVVIIIGIKGAQHNVASALVGHTTAGEVAKQSGTLASSNTAAGQSGGTNPAAVIAL